MYRIQLWAFLALVLACSQVVEAAPGQRRVSIVGDASRSMGIAWTTPDLVDSIVRFGTSASYDRQATGTAPHLVTDIGYVHEVTLSDLQPGTVYHYSVGDGSEFSDDATFTTAPADPCTPWRFVALGDDRTQFGEGGHAGVSKNYPSILEEASSQLPALILNSGDLVLSGSVAEQWVDYLDSTEPIAKTLPMLTAMGNHDDDRVEGDAAIYNGIVHLPRNNDDHTEDYNYVRYQNAIFVTLSTQTFTGASATDNRGFAHQAEWLDRVLGDNADATWKIVAYHHPSFTGGGVRFLGQELGHPPNEKHQNELFLPIFDAHHVDFVITGHNHWYERFYPTNEGAEPSIGELASGPDEGTIHFTAGGAGAYTMDLPLLGTCENEDMVGNTRAICSGDHHYILFKIHGNSVDIETWSTACQNNGCDNTPAIIDSLSYTKSGADVCQGGDDDAGQPGDASSSTDAPTNHDAGMADSAVSLDHPGAVDARSRPDTRPAPDATAIDTSLPDQVVLTYDASPAGSDDNAGSVNTPVACGCKAASPGWAGCFGLLALAGLVRRRR